MGIDIRTLVFVLGITHLIQMAAFLQQYRTNRTYPGIGWWLLWSAAEVLGFTCILLRGIPSIFKFVVVAQNSLLVLGTIFLYVGVRRFLDKRENLQAIVAAYAVYLALLIHFTFVRYDFETRSVIICLALAAPSFFTAWSLFAHKTPEVASSANFNAVAFLVHGLVLTHRAVMFLAGAPIHDIFTPQLINYITFLDGLIVGLLWTFGFIIMLNQRLNSEIAEAKEHFEMIFNTSPDGALITRLEDGVILDVNGGFTAISGFTREESIGKSSLEINVWKNLEDREAVVHELRKTGRCINYEAPFQRKDGGVLTGLISAQALSLKGKPHVISVTRDITERKKAEEEIHRLNAELEERVLQRTSQLESSYRELEDFVYSVSHDLRAPLRAMNGFSCLVMEEYADKIDDEGNRLLNVIRANTQYMDNLIADLMELFRTARAPIQSSPIDMAAMAQAVYEEVAPPEVRGRFEFSIAALPEAMGDPALMRQVWRNLLANAIKFTFPRETRRIEVGGYTEKDKNVYFVKDTGVGFDPRYIHKLFGVFQRLHQSSEFEGTGIGLAIVQRIVQRHGGQTWAEGKVGEGSVFYFSLPQKGNKP